MAFSRCTNDADIFGTHNGTIKWCFLPPFYFLWFDSVQGLCFPSPHRIICSLACMQIMTLYIPSRNHVFAALYRKFIDWKIWDHPSSESTINGVENYCPLLWKSELNLTISWDLQISLHSSSFDLTALGKILWTSPLRHTANMLCVCVYLFQPLLFSGLYL